MLIVISDLHFVDGTAGEHNLPTEAFSSLLLSNIVALAKDKRATEIKLLLLGDIPDLVRSQQWFDEKLEDRPWGENGLSDIPYPRAGSRTEQRCLDILGRFPADGQKESVPPDTILYKNWRTFEFFRYFKPLMQERLGGEIPVEVIYVVGNHDRLCNLYPSVRDELRKILGLTVSPRTVDLDYQAQQWWYRYDFIDEAYGVYARHGHQYDNINYNGGPDYTRRDHLQVPIGDLIATEFAVNLPRTLANMKGKYSNVSDLIERLKEIDNVRPSGRIMEWLYYQIRLEHNLALRQALDETFDKVLIDFVNIDFVKQWNNSDSYWDEFLRTVTGSFFRWVPTGILKASDTSSLLPRVLPLIEGLMGSDEETNRFAASAYREPIWQENRAIRYILYGHTHRPVIQSLDARDGQEVIYINTGTWRGQIQRTLSIDVPADFVSLKQLTYVAFYNQDEDRDRKVRGSVSFDMWTGHKKKYYRS
ncbi:MAG: hypothetical protein ACPGWR_23325 [Ardenticatenaceae bacterium]